MYREVWNLFSLSSTDVPALLPCAMLPKLVGGTFKKQFTKPTVQFILSLSRQTIEFTRPPDRQILILRHLMHFWRSLVIVQLATLCRETSHLGREVGKF